MSGVGIFVARAGGQFGELAALVGKSVGQAVVELAPLWGCPFDAIALFLVKDAPDDASAPPVAPDEAAVRAALLRDPMGSTTELRGGAFVIAVISPRPLGEHRWPHYLGHFAGTATGIDFFVDLLKTRMDERHILQSVVRRARIRCGHLVVQAILGGRADDALEAYRIAEALPSTSTVECLLTEGYKVGGALREGSDITVCYKGEHAFLLKGLDEREASRARDLLEACGGHQLPHITPFSLWRHGSSRCYMLMPKFASSLETLPHLSSGGIALLWAHARQALEALHALGFSHNDVKPSNICVNEVSPVSVSFVLIDLNSVARFGQGTSSTPVYVPDGVSHARAAPALDWWMLAMTLAEKACGPVHGLAVGSSLLSVSRGALVEHLGAHLLDRAVWSELEPKLRQLLLE